VGIAICQRDAEWLASTNEIARGISSRHNCHTS